MLQYQFGMFCTFPQELRKNEVFVDVIERMSVLVDTNVSLFYAGK